MIVDAVLEGYSYGGSIPPTSSQVLSFIYTGGEMVSPGRNREWTRSEDEGRPRK